MNRTAVITGQRAGARPCCLITAMPASAVRFLASLEMTVSGFKVPGSGFKRWCGAQILKRHEFGIITRPAGTLFREEGNGKTTVSTYVFMYRTV